jgi:hypothetical protein
MFDFFNTKAEQRQQQKDLHATAEILACIPAKTERKPTFTYTEKKDFPCKLNL